jgi:N-methylhydantoinase A
VVEGIREVLDGLGRTTRDVTWVLYGTTLATNTLVERNGARVGLVTTAGFRDVLELARSDPGEDVFNLFFEKPKPLVARELRREVHERVDARGQVLVPLDRDEVAGVARDLVSAGAEVLAVALINSFVNSAHEEEIGDLVGATWPEIWVLAVEQPCNVGHGGQEG